MGWLDDDGDAVVVAVDEPVEGHHTSLVKAALSGEVSAIISPSRRSARLRISRLSSLAGHRQPC